MAFTVTVATPLATAVNTRFPPSTAAETTFPSDEVTAWVSASPSGSLKWRASSSVTVRPASIVRSPIASVASGGRLGTVTVNAWVAARPSLSVAVTVTVAVPLAAAVTMSSPRETFATATAASEDVAANTRMSPSGSVKWAASSSAVVSPTSTVCSPIGAAGSGARLGTVTVNSCVAACPSGSVAATTSLLVPLANAVTVSVTPDIRAPATFGSDDSTV